MKRLKIKEIKPIFTQLVTTYDCYTKEDLGDGFSVNVEGAMKEYQRVISVGDAVRGIKPNDMVIIDPAAYTKKRYDENSLQNDLGNNKVVRIDMPVYEMDDQEVLLLDQNDIKMVFLGEEIDVKENLNIIMPNKDIII